MDDYDCILCCMTGLCHRVSHSGQKVYTVRLRAHGSRRSEGTDPGLWDGVNTSIVFIIQITESDSQRSC